MPKLGADVEIQTTQLGGNFSFSGVRLEKLKETQYTLATIAIDVTGSIQGFADELHDMLEASILSLKKHPRAGNMLVRVITFSSEVGVNELHGFKPLNDIDVVTAYAPFNPNGLTNLFDATYSAIEAMARYGKDMIDNYYSVNAIGIFITDGGDNASKMTPSAIKDAVHKIRTAETLESITLQLIGMNTSSCAAYLDRFKNDAALDAYIDMGDVTPQKLAKLGGWVAASVSSTSQALGSGGPSKTISATI